MGEKRNIDSYKIDIDIENRKFVISEIIEDNLQVEVEGTFENAQEISNEFYYLIKGIVSNKVNLK